ncbi:hypothetical protein ACFVXQ_33110 [Kitasatospora sp. NPDC058263]
MNDTSPVLDPVENAPAGEALEPRKSLGVHFATVDHDTAALTGWVGDRFDEA